VSARRRATLRMREGFDWQRVAWGRPDSPPRLLCSYCHARLAEDEVPLIIWADDGRGMQLCDQCVETWVAGVKL
jgi:hypothetical protein